MLSTEEREGLALANILTLIAKAPVEYSDLAVIGCGIAAIEPVEVPQATCRLEAPGGIVAR
jgi:hypothetical protein